MLDLDVLPGPPDRPHLGAGPQHPLGQRLPQEVQQVRPVQDHDGAVPAFERAGVGARQPPPARFPYARLAFGHRTVLDGPPDPQRVQGPDPVGPEGDPGPDLPERGSPLQHLDVPSAPVQGQGGRQPADPAADHDGGPLAHVPHLYICSGPH
ncbi:hypothetical protein GCM10009678_68130 [Actinomadura kijaniata]